MKQILLWAFLVCVAVSPVEASAPKDADIQIDDSSLWGAGTKTADEKATAVGAATRSDMTQPVEGSIYRKEFASKDPFMPPADSLVPSVNISEEFAVTQGEGSRKNIDSYLGDFENPFAPLEATYEGSRSELRNEIKERRGL